MPKTVHLSDGSSHRARLVVCNVTGLAEERGYRLYWQNLDEPNLLTPAEGLATSSPYAREYLARAAGERLFGERAVRAAY